MVNMDNSIYDNKIHRLILKDDDILVIKVPDSYFRHQAAIKALYTQIKKQILPKKNKILMLMNSVDISVIGKKEIEEYVSHVDLWSLFDEEGEETNERSIEGLE